MLSIMIKCGVLKRIHSIRDGQLECQKFLYQFGEKDWIGDVWLNGHVVANIDTNQKVIKKGKLADSALTNEELFTDNTK